MTENPEWYICRWSEMKPQHVESVLQLRQDVFIIEQTCIYADIDGMDEMAHHIFTTDAKGKCLAYARIFPAGTYMDAVSFGRFCTARHVRKKGLGRLLMLKILAFTEEMYPAEWVKISAQSYLRNFYAEYGFSTVGDEYQEDGIPHFLMLRSSDR